MGTKIGAITGFGNVDGVMCAATSAASIQCAADLLIAYNQLNAVAPTFSHSVLLGNGETLLPGVYSLPGVSSLTLNLILDAQGDENAVFIFQIQAAFSTNTNSKIILINEAKACNVFWKVEGLVDMAPGTTMRGTVIANNAAINLNAGDTLEGRALSTTGAVNVSGTVAFTPLGCGSPVLMGPLAPTLASTECYALFSSSGAVSNNGITHVTGDVGTNAGAISGFDPLLVTGTIHTSPDVSTSLCASDLLVVYNYLNTLPPDIELLYPAQFGNDLVLTPHTYLLNAATVLTNNLYLNAQGNPDAVFVFKIVGALSTGTLAKVILINGTQAKNVFWKVDGAVSISDYSEFRGTLVCNNGAVNVSTGVMLDGRMLAILGAFATDAINAIATGVTFCCGSYNAWNNSTGNSAWTTGANWSLGHVPDDANQGIIQTGTTLTITDVPDNTHLDKLHILKNGSNGTKVTLKGVADSSVLILNGLMSCNPIDFKVEEKCELHCNETGHRINIILMPRTNGLLQASELLIPADNAVFEPAAYYSCDAVSEGNINKWTDTASGGNILNYYKTKGLLLRSSTLQHAEFIQEAGNDRKVNAWVEWYMTSYSPTFAYNNVHYTCIPVSTDLVGIPCCSGSGDVLHCLNDMNNFGQGIKPSGYFVRKWDGLLQNWSARNDPPFFNSGWYGAFTNSCDGELDILHSAGAVNNPSLGHVETGEGIEIFPTPSFPDCPSMVWYGPLNTFPASAPLTWNVSLPASPDNYGWILAGNPFPSSVKLGEIGGSISPGSGWSWPSTFDPGIWYYDASGQVYRFWNYETGDLLNFPPGKEGTANYIPGSQGFFVYAYAPPPGSADIFQLDNGARQFQPKIQPAKSVVPNVMINTLHLYVTNNDQNIEMDEMAVHFIENAGTNYIPRKDAFKMFRGAGSFGELYTITNDNVKVAIKNYQSASGTTVVPVYFQVGPTGNYTFTAKDLNSFSSLTGVSIVDKKLNKTQDLKANPDYSFAAVSGDGPYRFDILFTRVLNSVNATSKPGLKVYSTGNSIIVVGNNSRDVNGTVTIYDITGRSLLREDLHGDLITRMITSLEKGYYLVSVRTDKTVINQKVYIN